MGEGNSFAIKVTQLIALVLLAAASLGALGIGIAFSAGAWTNKSVIEDTQNVVRVMAGVFGAFAVTAAAELVLARKRDERIADNMMLLEQQMQSVRSAIHPGIDAVLKNRDELQPWRLSIANCKHLQMSGLSLRTFTNENLGSIRGMLEAGGKCEFLLLQPESRSSAITAKNFLGQDNPYEYDNEIRASINRLAQLQKRFPSLVEIRTLDHIPAASITIVETGEGAAAIYVEFYTEEESSSGRPHLELHADDAPLWFSYFRNQFHVLWIRASRYAGES